MPPRNDSPSAPSPVAPRDAAPSLPLAPAAPAAPFAPEAPAADPRDAELAALKERLAQMQEDAELAAMEHADRLAAALKSAPAPVAESIGAEVRVPYVAHASVQFNGKIYGPGERYPFDPKNPPGDVSGIFIEGVDYVYR